MSTDRLATAAPDTARGMMTIPPVEAATLATAIRLDNKASTNPAAIPTPAVAVVNPAVTVMTLHLV